MDYIIVGLGNPEKKYDCTRHNIGFAALDLLAQKLHVKADRLKFKSLCGEGTIGQNRVLLMKPTTYMNLSGQAVQEAMQFYKLPIERVIVISDDASMDVGRLRIRMSGSDGGHNGLKNIIYLTGQDSFPRIKIGVGQKPHPDYDMADWVLGKFTEADRKTLLPLLEDVEPICEMLMAGDFQGAMGRYNR
ncbi:MAG: aminoacyl-tRNA hydrolase [Angelakisella sp.]